MSIDLAASVAIIHLEQILLIKREDVEMWALPSGQVEPGESLSQAAIREVGEETGLEVELTRLVGIYSFPHWLGGNHTVLFAATSIRGQLKAQAGEVLEVKYFAAEDIPEDIIWWHRQRINDALKGIGGSVTWRQNVSWPFDQIKTRAGLYTLRDQSGLSRREFFQRHFSRPVLEERVEVLEVGSAGEEQ